MVVKRAQYVELALHDWGEAVFNNLFAIDQARAAYDAEHVR
jgi:hypothetical protein